MSTPRPVLVIYTGGTIGMRPSEAGLIPSNDIPRRLAAALATLPPAQYRALPPYEMIATPRPIDSSAATPGDWQDLAALIAQQYARHRHAGIVVLHGTDTLAWSASSLAYQLAGINIPVILTGAMLPLEAPGSDALANVQAALRFAALPTLREVSICFAGKLLRGVRTRKWHTQAADAFKSPNHPPLGAWIEGQPVLYPEHGLPRQHATPQFTLPDYRHSACEVARITLWPGIAAWQVAAWLEHPRTNGALLEVWGAGNLPSDPELLETLARANDNGKLLAALSQCPHGSIEPGHYAAGQGLLDAGVLSARAMTPEAAVTKLIHLLAQPLKHTERRQLFSSPLAGEC